MKSRSFSVFVKAIDSRRGVIGATVVTATNGSDEGPTLVEFQIPNQEQSLWRVGQRVNVTLEWED